MMWWKLRKEKYHRTHQNEKVIFILCHAVQIKKWCIIVQNNGKYNCVDNAHPYNKRRATRHGAFCAETYASFPNARKMNMHRTAGIR